MEPSSSGPDDPTSVLPTADPPVAIPAQAERSWLRSRRTQTFGLGALCGALGLSLVIVVTSIVAAAGEGSPALPVDPAPVSEQRTSPTPTPVREHAIDDPTDESTDAAPPAVDAAPPIADPAPAPEPLPAPAPTAAPADDSADAPGRSGTAPGHNKEPKKP